MKSNILYIVIGLSVMLSSCTDNSRIIHRKSSKLPLRQMINDKETSISSSAWFFILGGGYSSHSVENNYVKCLAKADGCYYFLKMNLAKVRIKINNKVKNPYIVIDYADYKMSDEYLIVNSYHVDFYTIVCPEKYLPKNLTPIKI